MPAPYDFSVLLTEINPLDILAIMGGAPTPSTVYDYLNSPVRIHYRETRALKAIEVFVGAAFSNETAIN